MPTPRFMLPIAIILCLCFHAGAQSPDATPAKPEAEASRQQLAEAERKLEAQAFELLDAMMKDVGQLQLPENRIYISTNVADLLWPHDAQAARLLFKNAMSDLRALLDAPLTDESGPRLYKQRRDRFELRRNLLLALARHDGRMARQFLSETRPTDAELAESHAFNEDELELQLATIIAEHDPAQAFEMAEKLLAKGFSQHLPSLVMAIRKQDAEAASRLASNILTKLKTATLATDQSALSTALWMAHLATEQPEKNAVADKKVVPLLGEASLRELAELLGSAVMDGWELMSRLTETESLLLLMDKYAPARAQQVRRKLAQPKADGSTAADQTWHNFQELAANGTVEEILEAAEKNNQGVREMLYQQAAFRLAKEGQGEQARSIITRHIKDPQQQEHMLAELDKQLLTSAAVAGKSEETRKLLARTRNNEERIAALTQLAIAVKQKGNTKLALQLLDDARTYSPNRPKYARQLAAHMQIARAYTVVEPARSFPLLEASIDQLNEIIAAGILLGEFFGEEEVVKNDELLIQAAMQLLGEGYQEQFGGDVALLAAADFTRTRDVAERFQRMEIRLLARLLVVRSALSKKRTEGPNTQDDAPGANQTGKDIQSLSDQPPAAEPGR